MKPSHIIQRQVFELEVTGAKVGFEWERNAAQYQEDIIAKAVEECFHAIPVTGRQLVIEKLEIDLGSFSPESFRKEASGRLVRLLSDHLKTCFKDSARHTWDDAHGITQVDEAHSKTDTVLLDEAVVSRIVFLHVLEHGRFPWWYAVSEPVLAMETLFGKRWMKALTDDDQDVLKYILQKSEQARIRIANHFSDQWLGEFLQHIGLFGNDALVYWRLLLPILKHSAVKQVVLHQHFWVSWIKTIQTAKQYPKMVRALLEVVAQNDKPLLNKLLNTLKKSCMEKLPDTSFSRQASYLLNSLDKQQRSVTSATGSSSDTVDMAVESLPSAIPVEMANEAEKKVTGGSYEELDEIDTKKGSAAFDKYQLSIGQIEEAYFVQAAGLVLLHPFLPALMGSTGLWKANMWSSSSAIFRGIKLLSYLSFGNSNHPEYQLLFHKLLVGMDLDVALQAVSPLTRKETAACDELLQAAVGHWKALGNVSPASLQEGFLQRQGQLRHKDDGYHLQIEHQTLDVLLAHLPWGYSTVKLPWMSKIIHTSWI